MNAKPLTAPANDVTDVTTEKPVMDGVAELSPNAKATLANRLPKEEQLNQFEKDLEEHDPGNQPA
jgi:hypothetical protein